MSIPRAPMRGPPMQNPGIRGPPNTMPPPPNQMRGPPSNNVNTGGAILGTQNMRPQMSEQQAMSGPRIRGPPNSMPTQRGAIRGPPQNVRGPPNALRPPMQQQNNVRGPPTGISQQMGTPRAGPPQQNPPSTQGGWRPAPRASAANISTMNSGQARPGGSFGPPRSQGPPASKISGGPPQITNNGSSFAGPRPPSSRPPFIKAQQPHTTGQQQFQSSTPPTQQFQAVGGVAQQQDLAPKSEPFTDIADACDKRYMRCTAEKLPGSASALAQSRLPVGILCCPMALDVDHESPLDVVNFGSTGIIRCKKCRAYVNPYVSWVNNGRQWRCNVCGFVNEVPNSYFCQLDPETGRRRDVDQRPELLKGSVELSAPGEYMVRPPQPPVYVFCIDVSTTAIASGVVDVIADSILASLDKLPGKPRTLVALITYDATCVHFYNLKASLSTPQMISVPDISDLFIPLPDDLLVNLTESREIIEHLLRALPKMHNSDIDSQPIVQPSIPPSGVGPYPTQPPYIKNNRNSSSSQNGPALGSALTAAYRVMGHIGGKLCVFISSLPTCGEAALKPRENPRAYGTDAERLLLRPESTGQNPHWYETRAVEFSRLQIGVELFCTAQQYTDVATLSVLPRITAGQLYYYPNFTLKRDGQKLGAELVRALSRPTGFEAVMRVRCTRGLRVSAFRGNYYIRGHDLLALPNCSPESIFALELSHDDQTPMTTDIATVQASLLYTTSSGERRIRVHTMVIPVAHNVQDIVNTADVDVICNLLAKSAVDIALKQGLDAARTKLQQKCVDIVAAARSAITGAPTSVPAYARGPSTNQRLPPHMQQQYGGPPPSSIMMGGNGPPTNLGGPPSSQANPDSAQSALKLPKSLELLPLYTMGILKSAAFRGGTDINVDERSFILQRLDNMSPQLTRYFIYPRVLPLHMFLLNASTQQDKDLLPPPLNLSCESIVSDGLYLLDNSLQLTILVGANLHRDLLETLFIGDLSSDIGELELKPLISAEKNNHQQSNHLYLLKLHNIIEHLRTDRPPYLMVDIIREGHPTKQPIFLRHFIEDPANFPGGQFTYKEFMAHIQRHS